MGSIIKCGHVAREEVETRSEEDAIGLVRLGANPLSNPTWKRARHVHLTSEVAVQERVLKRLGFFV
jgi:hypothetical protein